IALDAVTVRVDDWADADVGSPPAAHAAARHLGVEELGETFRVPAGVVDRHVALGVVLKAGNALVDVGGPARLRELAVIDDVDAGLRLPAHHAKYGITEGRLVGLTVDRPA